MNRRTAIRGLAIFFLTTASLAEAQQAGKIFRIGFLDGSTAAGMAVLCEGVPARAEQAWLDRGKEFHHRVPFAREQRR